MINDGKQCKSSFGGTVYERRYAYRSYESVAVELTVFVLFAVVAMSDFFRRMVGEVFTTNLTISPKPLEL